jgi:hypothetical protein
MVNEALGPDNLINGPGSSPLRPVSSIIGSVETCAQCLFRSMESLREALNHLEVKNGGEELDYFRDGIFTALKESQQELDDLLFKLRDLIKETITIGTYLASRN